MWREIEEAPKKPSGLSQGYVGLSLYERCFALADPRHLGIWY